MRNCYNIIIMLVCYYFFSPNPGAKMVLSIAKDDDHEDTASHDLLHDIADFIRKGLRVRESLSTILKLKEIKVRCVRMLHTVSACDSRKCPGEFTEIGVLIGEF